MCVINVKTYVHPDGRRETIEDPRFCERSDKVNPCYNHIRRTQTEVILASSSSHPASPGLAYDDASTPVSGSFPTTPISATSGPRVEIRQPVLDRTPSTKDKGKKKVIEFSDLTFHLGRRSKKYPRRRRTSDRSSRYYDDDDEIIAIEDRGIVHPTTPTRQTGIIPPPPPAPMPVSQSPSSPTPITRLRRPRVEIHQPNPPQASASTLESPAVPMGHRRTFTAPEIDVVRTHSDNEMWDRADARERLRQENRERRREQDARQRLQEEADRRLAERLTLGEKERREKAEDEFSRHEYERIQDREELRRQAKERREKEGIQKRIEEQLELKEVEQIESQIREAKERRDRSAARRAEERAAKLAAELHQQYEATSRRADDLEAQLERINSREAKERQLRETQEQIARLEREGREARREARRNEARERRLVDAVHAAEDLQAEIRNLERQLGHTGISSSEQRPADERDRVLSPVRPGTSPLLNDRFTTPYASSSSPRRSPAADTLLSARSPTSQYQDPEFRRARGEQVLQREWARGAQTEAQVASQAMQYAIGYSEPPGLERRNTTGGNRARDTRYRDQFRRYPS